MRKRYINIIAVCMAAIVVAACGKEQIQQIVPDPEPGNEPEVEVEALDKLTVEAEVATKTTLNGSNVDWSDGDAISVFSTTHSVNHEFVSSLSQDKRKAKFSGEIESGTTEMVAVYPYTSGAVYSGGKITGISIPTAQTATESSFANGASVTIAKATKAADAKTVQLAFHNLCAVLQFTVPEGMEESSKIRVESINTAVKMSGAATIDIANSAITASEPYVELTGSFISGHTYCVTVAPGNYNQSFKFILTGKRNGTFERTLKVDGGVNAEKGGIYVIGALNPEPADGAASISSCSIAHTYANSTLTGSTATVTFATNVTPNEFANNIKGWKVKNVTMKDQNGTVYRTLDETKFTNDQTITLTAVSGKPYMPKGSYTFSADIYYTVKKADGSDADKKLKTVTTTVTSPAPNITFNQNNISGYTSYSCYNGNDGQAKSTSTANSLDNSTIYNVGFTHINMLSDDVYEQCKNSLLSSTTTVNGTTINSGKQNVTVTNWKTYTISCTITFDSITKNASKDVHVTGLPYRLKHKANEQGSHSWSMYQGRVDWNTDNIEIYYSAAKEPIVQSCSFYVPEDNIPIKVTGLIKRSNDYAIAGSHNAGVKINGSDEQTHSLGKGGTWNVDISKWTLSDKGWFEVQYHYAAGGPHTFIYSFNVDYRSIN